MLWKSMDFENVPNVRHVLCIFWSCRPWWGSNINNRKWQFLEIRKRLHLSVLHLGKSLTIPRKTRGFIIMKSLLLSTLEILLVNGIFSSPGAWLTNSRGVISARFMEGTELLRWYLFCGQREKKMPVDLCPMFHFILHFQPGSRDVPLILKSILTICLTIETENLHLLSLGNNYFVFLRRISKINTSQIKF